MYSGFITPKRTVAQRGIHQRLDMAAYHMIEQYLPTKAGTFPGIKEIVHFEGYNGPDGLKVKSRGQHEPSHLYDPATDTGQVPDHIAGHYAALVRALSHDDQVRAAFEAAWMAHYIGDGLTPAHHWPLEEKLAEAAAKATRSLRQGDTSKFTATAKKHWALWGAKGHLTTHFNFEMGIAFALLIFPIKPEFSEYELARAGRLGAVDYFKSEARAVAELDLYERFYREGWTNKLATIVKNELAPRTARAIGLIWLMALLEAGQEVVVQTQSQAQSQPETPGDAQIGRHPQVSSTA